MATQAVDNLLPTLVIGRMGDASPHVDVPEAEEDVGEKGEAKDLVPLTDQTKEDVCDKGEV